MRRSIAFVMAAILVLFLNAYMVSAQTLFPGGLTQLPPDNPTPNLVLNPGFESVSGGVPASWSTGSGWSADQTVKHSGTYSYKWTGGPSVQQQIAVTAGTYNLSAWIKPGPSHWKPLTTRGEIGKSDGPFAVDTLTIPYDNPQKAFLRSRATSIEGGTSEVMRNILGERVLGLPKG